MTGGLLTKPAVPNRHVTHDELCTSPGPPAPLLTPKGVPAGRPLPPGYRLGFHRISTNFHTYMDPNGVHISTAISTVSAISVIRLP